MTAKKVPPKTIKIDWVSIKGATPPPAIIAASIAPIAPTNPTNEAISITALQLSRVYLYKNCTIYKNKAGFMAHILHFNTKRETIKMISRLLIYILVYYQRHILLEPTCVCASLGIG